MSTDYYLVQTDPTPIYGRAKVAQKSGGNVSLWTDDDIECSYLAYADIAARIRKLMGDE